MLRFILRRLLLVPVVLLGMMAVTFTLSQIVPTDPVAAFLGARTDLGGNEAEAIARIQAQWGWDKPIVERFFIYVGNVLQGNLGMSSTSRRPVIDDLLDYTPSTLELVGATLLVAFLIAIPLGVFTAGRRGGWFDGGFKLVSVLVISAPIFWLAILVTNLLYRDLGLVGGAGQIDIFITPPPRVTGMLLVDSILDGNIEALVSHLRHMILPVGLLGTVLGLYMARILRTEMANALDSDYVRTARGKGLGRRQVLYGHALRNALIPMITLSGLAIGTLLTSTIVIESLFGWSGLGTYAYLTAVHVDLPGIAGVTLVVGIVYLTVNLIVDILYAVADPRVRVR